MPTTRGSRWFANGSAQSPIQFTWAGCARPVRSNRQDRDAGVRRVGLYRESAARRHPQPVESRTHTRRIERRFECGVSSAMVPFATASDGGGSIRTPRASPDSLDSRTPTDEFPLRRHAPAQNSVVGSLTTSVRDTALLLDVMAGPDSRDRTSLPRPPSRTWNRSTRSTSRVVAWRGRATSASPLSIRGSPRSVATRHRRSRHRSALRSSNDRSNLMTTFGPTWRSKG